MYYVLVLLLFAVPVLGSAAPFLPRLHWFFRLLLPLLALLWIVDFYLSNDAAAFDCWPSCTDRQQVLGALLVMLPLPFLATFIIAMVQLRIAPTPLRRRDVPQ